MTTSSENGLNAHPNSPQRRSRSRSIATRVLATLALLLGILTGLVPGTPAGATGPPPLTGISQLTAGSYHTCALLTNGTVTCWGNGVYGQLGNGAGTSSNIQVPVTWVPQLVERSRCLDACLGAENGLSACWEPCV